MSRAGIERRLAGLTDEIRAAREELRVLDEQLQHFTDSAEEARLRALVSETPLAAREHEEAARTVTALQNDRNAWAGRLAGLEARQDQLLDQLLEESS